MFSALTTSTDWILPFSPQQQAQSWQQSRSLASTDGDRWNAYLNQLCLETCLNWLKTEHLPNLKPGTESAWCAQINGASVMVDRIRIALIPTEAVDRSEIQVAQEWVDVPSWAADYYLGIQISPDCQEMAIYGYTTHQQLKTQGTYDAQERTYCLDAEDLIPDLNALWLSYPRYTSSQTRATVTALPTLDLAQVDRLIDRLGNPAQIMPRLAVPFPTWAALLEHPQWRQRLYQQRQIENVNPVVTQLGQWLQGEIDRIWQTLDLVLLPQQIARSIRSGSSLTPAATSPEEIYRAKIYSLEGGEIALVVGISPLNVTESRISLQVHPTRAAVHLPGKTQLRLLATDGSELGQVSAAVTETIQLQFRANQGEQFQIEISCAGQTLTEVFQL
jgi:Protein of unknown function (DUF1822)